MSYVVNYSIYGNFISPKKCIVKIGKLPGAEVFYHNMVIYCRRRARLDKHLIQPCPFSSSPRQLLIDGDGQGARPMGYWG